MESGVQTPDAESKHLVESHRQSDVSDWRTVRLRFGADGDCDR